VCSLAQSFPAYAWFNNEANHALGESVNILDNIILQDYLGDNT
jgi:hypothetical protein